PRIESGFYLQVGVVSSLNRLVLLSQCLECFDSHCAVIVSILNQHHRSLPIELSCSTYIPNSAKLWNFGGAKLYLPCHTEHAIRTCPGILLRGRQHSSNCQECFLLEQIGQR